MRRKVKRMTREYYEEKWKEYVDLVNDISKKKQYERINIDCDWLERFNEAINLPIWKKLRRKFNDIDIAACLICSLTWTNREDKHIIFAFDCAKRLIEMPREYYRCKDNFGEVDLGQYRTANKVNINLPDEVLTMRAIVTIIRTYLTQENEERIIQLSDFLHILYLRCK